MEVPLNCKIMIIISIIMSEKCESYLTLPPVTIIYYNYMIINNYYYLMQFEVVSLFKNVLTYYYLSLSACLVESQEIHQYCISDCYQILIFVPWMIS